MCPLCYTSLDFYQKTSEKLKQTLEVFSTIVLMVTACSSVWNGWANIDSAGPTGRKPPPIALSSADSKVVWDRRDRRWCFHGTWYRAFWWRSVNYLVHRSVDHTNNLEFSDCSHEGFQSPYVSTTGGGVAAQGQNVCFTSVLGHFRPHTLQNSGGRFPSSSVSNLLNTSANLLLAGPLLAKEMSVLW